MKKILVQEKLTLAKAIALIAIVLVAAAFLVFVAAKDFVSAHTRYEIYGFITFAAIIVPIWWSSAKKGVYVSELILDNEALTLVYNLDNNIIKQDVINLKDINSIHAKLIANRVQTGKTTSLFCETEVQIDTKSNGLVSFTEEPTASFSFCSYSFMLRLLSFAKNLPNFTYEVEGNVDSVKEDVKHYAIYGKRLSYFKREWINFMQMPLISRVVTFICSVVLIFGVCFLAYFIMPSFSTSEDKEYISLIETGYELYRNNMCDEAIEEFDKALKIHSDDHSLYYYRALAYKKNKQYEKAIDEANKGIAVLDKKSVYDVVKKHIDSKDDIGLYTVIGDCNKKLKRYEEAKNAYDYVAANVRYVYTDVYFERGQCEYYLNRKEQALGDFYRHRTIIRNYLQDQASCKYKAKYPTYTQKSLSNIEKWIQASKNLS